MTRRGLCRLLFVMVALSMSVAASAGRGGGWYHGGGNGGGYGGVNHGSSWSGGGYGGVNHGGSWSGGGYGGVNHGSSWSGGGWNRGYHGGGWYHGSYYHGGYYHGGHYHGWYGCCGSVSVGFYFGPGFVYGYPFYPYYYPPYYASVYYPYVSGDLLQPTEYVEQGQAQGQTGVADMYDQGGDAPQLAFWYYCASPQGYYPYVRSCPGGWQKVPARPPDS